MIVYFSGETGFTHRFVGKLGLPSIRIPQQIKECKEFPVTCEYILFSPTYERRIVHGPQSGILTYIPRQVAAFLSQEESRKLMQGVVGFGNKNFHEDYARVADDISKRTGVPIAGRVELDGTDEDVSYYKERLVEFWHSK